MKSDAYRRDFVTLARDSGNCARIWLNDRGIGLESARAQVYDPDVLDQLDEILRAAQARDIRVILAFESGASIGRNTEKHPYFREMGGPLSASPEFFRNVPARKLFQNKLAYVAARYGAYRSVLAWELMDGIDDSWTALKSNPDNAKLPLANEIDVARRARRDVQDWVGRNGAASSRRTC